MCMKKFAERLREARIKFGITSVELARRLSVGSNTVSRWETGTREPDLETISKIADTLNVSAAYLIGSVDIPDKNLLADVGKNNEVPKSETQAMFLRLMHMLSEKNPDIIVHFRDLDKNIDNLGVQDIQALADAIAILTGETSAEIEGRFRRTSRHGDL